MTRVYIALLVMTLAILACGQPPILTTPTPAPSLTATVSATASPALLIYPTATPTPTATLGCDGDNCGRLATAVWTKVKP